MGCCGFSARRLIPFRQQATTTATTTARSHYLEEVGTTRPLKKTSLCTAATATSAATDLELYKMRSGTAAMVSFRNEQQKIEYEIGGPKRGGRQTLKMANNTVPNVGVGWPVRSNRRLVFRDDDGDAIERHRSHQIPANPQTLKTDGSATTVASIFRFIATRRPCTLRSLCGVCVCVSIVVSRRLSNNFAFDSRARAWLGQVGLAASFGTDAEPGGYGRTIHRDGRRRRRTTKGPCSRKSFDSVFFASFALFPLLAAFRYQSGCVVWPNAKT